VKHEKLAASAKTRAAWGMALILLLLLLTAAPAHACRKMALAAPLTDSQVFFTGVVTANTVEAGPGEVKYGLRDGRPGHAPARPIHGQVFRIERIGGPKAGGLPAGLGEIVVVPWDYDASCQTLAWPADAQWTPPGTRGFVTGTLRPREHWVNGRPTLDTHNPYYLPYTGSQRVPGISRDVPIEDFLAPDHVFELHQVLPTRSALARGGEEAVAPLRAWVAANPELASRPPAALMIGLVLRAMDRAALLETGHPMLGTWRFTLHVPGQGVHTLYARSELAPAGRWSPDPARPELDAGGLRLRPADGYSFLVLLGSSLEDLPATVEYRLGPVTAFMYALASPESTEEKLSWWGGIEPSLLAKAVPDDPLVQRAVAEATERSRARYRDDLPAETPARFVLGADGILRVRQLFPVRGAGEILLKGERISRTTAQRTPIEAPIGDRGADREKELQALESAILAALSYLEPRLPAGAVAMDVSEMVGIKQGFPEHARTLAARMGFGEARLTEVIECDRATVTCRFVPGSPAVIVQLLPRDGTIVTFSEAAATVSLEVNWSTSERLTVWVLEVNLTQVDGKWVGSGVEVRYTGH
jgi:hypothetical protein